MADPAKRNDRHLTMEELCERIDTDIVGPDQQSRGTEGCNYLLAIGPPFRQAV